MIDVVNSIKHYQPVFWNVDNSRLLESNRSNILYANEQNEKAQTKAIELATAIGNLDFHESQAAEKQRLIEEYDAMINNTLQMYGDNLRYGINNIIDMSRKLITDEGILKRIKTNNDYKDFVKSIKDSDIIDEDTKNYILDLPENQYKFESIVDNTGKIIGYKDWKAGKNPVAQVAPSDIALGVIKSLTPNTNNYNIRKFYDANDKQLHGSDIIYATYYVDSDGERTDLTSKQINYAIETYLKANPSATNSLYQDYYRAIHYYEKTGEDKYGIVKSGNDYYSPQEFIENTFKNFGEAFKYTKVSSSSKTFPIVKNDGDGDDNKSNKKNNTEDGEDIRRRNYNFSIGKIKVSVDEDALNNEREVSDNQFKKYLVEELSKKGLVVYEGNSYEQIRVKLDNNRELFSDAEITAYKTMITNAIDNKRNITAYNNEVIAKMPAEDRFVHDNYIDLNNGNYLDNENLQYFADTFVNLYKNEEGGSKDDIFVDFNLINPDLYNEIIKIANARNINIDEFINPDDKMFVIPHDATTFKIFADLVHDASDNIIGGIERLGNAAFNISTANHILEAGLRTEDEKFKEPYNTWYKIYNFGHEASKLKTKYEGLLKSGVGVKTITHTLNTNDIYDISETNMIKEGAKQQDINENREALFNAIHSVSLTNNKYKVYVDGNFYESVLNESNLKNKEKKAIKLDDYTDELVLVTDPTLLTIIQSKLRSSMDAYFKPGGESSTNMINYTKDKFENMEVGFTHPTGVEPGSYIILPVGDGTSYKTHTIFIGNSKFNDDQKDYMESPEYKARVQVDNIMKPNNRTYARSINVGLNNTLKASYADGTFYLGDKDIKKEDLIFLQKYSNDYVNNVNKFASMSDDVKTAYRNSILDENGNINRNSDAYKLWLSDTDNVLAARLLAEYKGLDILTVFDNLVKDYLRMNL